MHGPRADAPRADGMACADGIACPAPVASEGHSELAPDRDDGKIGMSVRLCALAMDPLRTTPRGLEKCLAVAARTPPTRLAHAASPGAANAHLLFKAPPRGLN